MLNQMLLPLRLTVLPLDRLSVRSFILAFFPLYHECFRCGIRTMEGLRMMVRKFAHIYIELHVELLYMNCMDFVWNEVDWSGAECF